MSVVAKNAPESERFIDKHYKKPAGDGLRQGLMTNSSNGVKERLTEFLFHL